MVVRGRFAAAGLAYLWSVWLRDRHAPHLQMSTDLSGPVPMQYRSSLLAQLLRFLMLYFVIGLAYLPWLNTAIERVSQWPKDDAYASPILGAQMTLQTLVSGPIRSAPDLSWPSAW